MTTQSQTSTTDTVVLRLAQDTDKLAVRRLAALDSALPLGGDVIVALSGGDIAAAISIHSGRVIADPFRPTADLVALLQARLGLLRGQSHGAGRGLAGRLRRAAA